MGSRWQVEKKNDPYYKRAKSEEYRSRASYKLKQLDKKYEFQGLQHILDNGTVMWLTHHLKV